MIVFPDNLDGAHLDRLGRRRYLLRIKWADWLASTIPGAGQVARLEGARIVFPEERWQQCNEQLRKHWTA
jgi:hypothetical protein